jgi:D-threo-aldose 1-dehydrogenase
VFDTAPHYGLGLSERRLGAALQFPLRHPAVATVVVGVRTPRHVASAVAGMTSPINEALWQSLG